METRTYGLLALVVVLLHYIIPYYVTSNGFDMVYWIIDSLFLFVVTLYYLLKGGKPWLKD